MTNRVCLEISERIGSMTRQITADMLAYWRSTALAKGINPEEVEAAFNPHIYVYEEKDKREAKLCQKIESVLRFSLNYCKKIGERYPWMEPYFILHDWWRHDYARDIIKGRWKEAEPYIINDPRWIFYYTKEVIKGRWLEAEPYIKKNAYWWSKYKKQFSIQEE